MGIVKGEGVKYIVGGDLTLGGEHVMQYTHYLN